MSDGFKHDVLSDLHGMTSRDQGSRNDRRTSATECTFAAKERGLTAESPHCPFCGGDLPMQNAELCKHCRKDLAWVQGVVCKPGQERQVLVKLEKLQEEKDAAQAQFQKQLPVAKKEWKELESYRTTCSILAYGNFLLFFSDLWFWVLWGSHLEIVLGMSFCVLPVTFYYLFFSEKARRSSELRNKYGAKNLL